MADNFDVNGFQNLMSFASEMLQMPSTNNPNNQHQISKTAHETIVISSDDEVYANDDENNGNSHSNRLKSGKIGKTFATKILTTDK